MLFYLLIILLPTQLGRHFWPEWAFVSGVRVDYFSPTLYLTDVLVIGIFLLELFKLRFPKISRLWWGGLGVVGVLGAANIYFSLSPAVSAYKWLKVLEMGFLVVWIARSGINAKLVAAFLLIPIFYESVLVIWQFMRQASVGGVWWLLGERNFNSGTLGIANTIINGQLWLRPYGTFPHPNVLGGFLAVSLPLVILYFPHIYRKINAAILSLGFVALFLTMSRSAIAIGVLATSVVLARRHKIRHIWLIWLIGGLFLLGIFRTNAESFGVREKMNELAIQYFSHSPVLGTGLGTSVLYPSTSLRIKNYALAHQPTHNGYLLILGETGVLGAVGILGIVKSCRKKNWMVLTPLLTIAALGLFDHYFLTLQQGQLLLALVLGLCFSVG